MKKLSSSLKNLIKILNDGEFHSGESLGKQLKISRNAVWKHINQLIKYDIAIESAQSKGYRLTQSVILLDSKSIRENISYNGKFKLNKIEILGNVDSTNTYLKHYASQQPYAIDICLAEHQTAGKGRFGRNWHSPFGANIYLSLSCNITQDISQLNGLALALGVAVIRSLEKFNIKTGIALKWPNDIFWQGEKLGGILIEVNAESHGMTQVIVGVGLNVNMPVKAQEFIARPWVSLNKIIKENLDRNKIVAVLLNYLLENLEKFLECGFLHYIEQWKQYDYLHEKPVALMVGQEKIFGTAVGINKYGHLLLQMDSGEIKNYSAGEASLFSLL